MQWLHGDYSNYTGLETLIELLLSGSPIIPSLMDHVMIAVSIISGQVKWLSALLMMGHERATGFELSDSLKMVHQNPEVAAGICETTPDTSLVLPQP